MFSVVIDKSIYHASVISSLNWDKNHIKNFLADDILCDPTLNVSSHHTIILEVRKDASFVADVLI